MPLKGSGWRLRAFRRVQHPAAGRRPVPGLGWGEVVVLVVVLVLAAVLLRAGTSLVVVLELLTGAGLVAGAVVRRAAEAVQAAP
ncbi:hypothetical protein HET69_28570 [Streptomyces sp. CJ_13]|uniref:hypothetical protein n=1 Tax=Streptomyces sp. CJ_13 TaxID=2724943 RepID=UPI001BDCAAAA|nr:hypothetical protein [Streptomyces sp. CJ_13]MBT1187832.1 hypothetical protein [Streptomyces sp. CJ_13]